MNVTKSCQVYNKTITDIDELRCRIMHIVTDLFYYDFGYICMGPISLIIAISIFGRLKGHYRWFILNQAIWDLITSSYYSCSFSDLSTYVKMVPSCFYLPKTYTSINNYWTNNLEYFVTWIIVYNSFSALFLLSTSRFMALYYPHTYSKLIKGRRIMYTIILFNLFIIFFDICPLFLILQSKRISEINEECMIQKNTTFNACNILQEHRKDFWYNFYTSLVLVFNLMQQSKPLLYLIPSLFASVMIILKIVKQIIFQVKQDRKDYSSNVRIAVVIGLQNVITCFGAFVELFNTFIPRIVSTFQLKIILIKLFVPGRDYTGYLDLRLPLWVDGSYGLSSGYGLRTIIQLRILIEALIVLVIMTGYREAVIDFVKYIYKAARSPMNTLKSFKFNKTKVSSPSLF